MPLSYADVRRCRFKRMTRSKPTSEYTEEQRERARAASRAWKAKHRPTYADWPEEARLKHQALVRKWAAENIERRAEINRQAHGRRREFNWFGLRLSTTRGNAKRRGLGFSITEDDLRYAWETQGGLCALTGDALVQAGPKWAVASVDRIDPTEGYVPGNVRWVTWRVNAVRSNLTDEEFVDLCRKVVSHAAEL